VALKQGFASTTRHFSALAVPHVASSGPFQTQADMSVMYYKYSPNLDQTKGFDLAMVSFELKGDGQAVCMMVSSHELPITPVQNLSACHGMDLRVAVPASSSEFCAPSTDVGACSYFIGIRLEGTAFPELKIGVNLQFSEPLYRHLFLSQDVTDNLHPEQRFKYVLPPGTSASQVIFNFYISPVMPVSSGTELLVSMTNFQSGSAAQIGVVRAAVPHNEISFSKDQLNSFLKLYKNLTFYLTLRAPTIPESDDYHTSPVFTLKTRVLGDSGQPIPQPTAPPSSGWRRGDSSSSQRSSATASNILWVWTARFVGVLAACFLLSCIIKTIRYFSKSRATRQAEALGDLLHQSKQNLEDAWSTAAIQAQAKADREVEMQQIKETVLQL